MSTGKSFHSFGAGAVTDLAPRIMYIFPLGGSSRRLSVSCIKREAIGYFDWICGTSLISVFMDISYIWLLTKA